MIRRTPILMLWLLGIGLATASPPAPAQALGQGDLLVSVASLAGAGPNTILEVNSVNAQVQSISVPTPTGGDTPIRDLTVDLNGQIQVYNGTFSPYLSTYNPTTGAWTHRTYDGWSTVNNVTYGGVAAFQNYVFVTDMATANNGSPNGLIRFNLADNTAQRFADGIDFISACLGWDGLLYGVAYGDGFGTPIYVYDPTTLNQLRSFHLPLNSFNDEFRSVAVAKNGDLFAIGLDGVIYHYDTNGNQLNTASIGTTYPVNLALAADGRIAIGREDGYVTRTDTSLTSFTSFQVSTNRQTVAFVAFVPPPPPAFHGFDVNGDGKTDLAFQNSSTGQVAFWYMNGQQVIGGGSASQKPQAGYKVVGVGNVQGGGIFDIVFQNTSTRQIAFWHMNGTTVVGGDLASLIPAPNWSVVAVGDLNGDGSADLIFQNSITRQIAFWYMSGTTITSSALLSTVPAANWQVRGIADINGDGKPDLVFQNTVTGQVAFWYMDSTRLIGGATLASVPQAGYSLKVLGDFNGDGKPDLVFQNSSTGQVAFWYLNGATVIGGGLATGSGSVPAPGYQIVGSN